MFSMFIFVLQNINNLIISIFIKLFYALLEKFILKLVYKIVTLFFFRGVDVTCYTP